MADRSFWKGKKVFITGHTGFKGSWLAIWLIEMGATVIGYALDPQTEKDNFLLAGLSKRMVDIRGDIRDLDKLRFSVNTYKPEILFHLAAQPIVLESYKNPLETYEINIMGTVNVLESIRSCKSIKEAILITTDKCYENKETLTGYVETDPLGGVDPYSASKACDEIIISSYRSSFFNPYEYEKHATAIASVRAGNVIGGGDWSSNRLIPDCIKALENKKTIKIRNRNSVRPWQHVLDPLNGYLRLAEKMWNEPITIPGAYNFGPSQESIWSVWNVASEVIRCYGRGDILDVSVQDTPHEANKLVLNAQKSQKSLGWKPVLSTKDAIEWAVEWYKEYDKADVYNLCKNEIERYESLELCSKTLI